MGATRKKFFGKEFIFVLVTSCILHHFGESDMAAFLCFCAIALNVYRIIVTEKEMCSLGETLYLKAVISCLERCTADEKNEETEETKEAKELEQVAKCNLMLEISTLDDFIKRYKRSIAGYIIITAIELAVCLA